VRNAYRILVEKLEWWRLQKSKHRQEDDLKIDLKENAQASVG
jgi:hypothetical protein